LTFPATSPLLSQVAGAYGLVRVQATTGRTEKRQLWITPSARDLLNGTSDAFFPVTAFSRLVEIFILGYLVRVSLLGDPSTKKPDFELLHTHDEVWVFCCRKPLSQQYRFFGRFTAEGEFVVLFGRDRKSLEGNGYNVTVQEFLELWRQMFGNHDCYRAESCEAYLGGVVNDVDED
jgi:hypothetical protein